MLLRNTNATLFPAPLYKYRPDLLDPSRYRVPFEGMGFTPSSSDPVSFVTSLFGGLLNQKSPEQIAYDTGREQIWQAGIANQHAKDSTVGGDPLHEGVTRSQLLPYIQRACELRQELIALTDRYRSSIDAAWLNPRLNDYLPTLDAWCTSWQAQYNALPSDSIFQSVTDYIFGTQQPVIPGVQPYVNPNTYIPADVGILPTQNRMRAGSGDYLLPVAIGAAVLFFAMRSTRARK